MIESRKKDTITYPGFEAIFDKADKNYDTALSLAVGEHQFQVVEMILAVDPAYKNGRVRNTNDLKSLISVVPRKQEKEYTYMVNLLIKYYEARKDIGHEDQTALHTAIIKRDEESVLRLLKDNKDLLLNLGGKNKLIMVAAVRVLDK
ncbi:hypothetical protein ACET3Z_014163 [Daucus carota]